MDKIDLDNLDNFLKNELELQKVSGKILLDRFCVIDEDSRRSPAYIDPNYSGFYYHLGKKINPHFMMEFGFDLGLLSGSFLVACKTVKKFLGYREASSEFVSLRLGQQNIKKAMKGDRKFYMGALYDVEIENYLLGGLDFAVVTSQLNYDKHLEYLDFIWSHMNDNGIIVSEYFNKNPASKQAFLAFSKSKNRKGLVFATRYGTGLMQK